MSGGITFRQAINFNKKSVLECLDGKDFTSTTDIFREYKGEPYIDSVRTALRELKKEGKVIDEIRGLNSKYWKLV